MVSTLKNTLAFVSKRITGLPARAPHASWGWPLPQSSEPGGRAARGAEVLLQLSELRARRCAVLLESGRTQTSQRLTFPPPSQCR
jgi:hypothetical protein